METTIENIAARILAGKRKRFFWCKPLFSRHASVFESDLTAVENELGCQLPKDLRSWLLIAGFGDVNDKLSFRREWFNVIDRGQLKGHVYFAQDILGNFYSFSTADGAIHFVSRSAPEYAELASGFLAFLEEFEMRGFILEEWTDGLSTLPYEWDISET